MYFVIKWYKGQRVNRELSRIEKNVENVLYQIDRELIHKVKEHKFVEKEEDELEEEEQEEQAGSEIGSLGKLRSRQK